MITSYQTTTDGTLIDFIQPQPGRGLLIVRAGQALEPRQRPIILRLSEADAREFGLHLAGFIASASLGTGERPLGEGSTLSLVQPEVIAAARDAIAAGGTHDCGEWLDDARECQLCGRTIVAT